MGFAAARNPLAIRTQPPATRREVRYKSEKVQFRGPRRESAVREKETREFRVPCHAHALPLSSGPTVCRNWNDSPSSASVGVLPYWYHLEKVTFTAIKMPPMQII